MNIKRTISIFFLLWIPFWGMTQEVLTGVAQNVPIV